MKKTIGGFSKLEKDAKQLWLAENFFEDTDSALFDFNRFNIEDEDLQQVFEGFSENTVANFILPYGVAPNFLINQKVYCVPMVIEESSVVAAASAAAKFWFSRGGFKTEIINTKKVGQVHFIWKGEKEKLNAFFPVWKEKLMLETEHLTQNMQKRGGGILNIALVDLNDLEDGLYQLRVDFETCDSMGANFINSVLEEFGMISKSFFAAQTNWSQTEQHIEIIMCILSNYTPECVVRASVSCPIAELGTFSNNELDAPTFAQKFYTAVKIANGDPYRATTHNKGIFNGIDAVVIATGNDFRAIEACGHAYAARDGQYRSLSHCEIKNDTFHFWIDIPLAVGTVGGLTKLHPMAKRSLALLGNPSAAELMSVIAATGLAQNFAAVRSLVTTGIQKGHMKMHLLNILNNFAACNHEMDQAIHYFNDKTVSYSAVRSYLEELRANTPVETIGKNG